MSCDLCHKEQEGFNPEIRIRWCWLSLDESFTHTVPNVDFFFVQQTIQCTMQ